MAERFPISLIRAREVALITPHMVRVTFDGPGLAGFVPVAPDQQVRLCFPRPGQVVPRLPEPRADGDPARWYHAYLAMPEDERPWMRTYTIRSHDPVRRTVDIDFVLHGDAGPASRWAMAVEPGDVLGMVGPTRVFARPIAIGDTPDVSGPILLAGDETALPAIGALLEWFTAGTVVTAFIEVADRHERQELTSRADVTVHWVHRNGVPAGLSDALPRAVAEAEFPSGPVFAWLAGEARTVRALRRHLINGRGLDRRSIDFTGYWRLTLTPDDPPTTADLADFADQAAAGAGS